MSSRFDPTAGENYGVCETCGIEIPAEADSKVHMSATSATGGGISHTIRVTNPTREQRIQGEVDSIVEDAKREAVENLAGMIDGGDVSSEEVTEALTWHSDFGEAFEDEASNG